MDEEDRHDFHDDPPVPKLNNPEMGQEQESAEVETDSLQEQIQVVIPPDPSIEWSFNVFLAEIAREINKDELEIMKSLFQGAISRGALEDCDTCTQLFSVMRTRRYLTPGNILYLNKMLDVLKRYDLTKKAVQYCRQEQKVVYYYSSTEDTGQESGTKRVKFHVVADIKRMNKETIYRLKNNAARIVCAPVELVTVEAVEPGSSLIIVLKFPDIYVSILRNLLQDKANLWELSLLEVDIIVIEEEVYNLTETDNTSESEQQKEILNIYEQLKRKCEELEKIDFQALNNCKEIEKLRLQLDKCQEELSLKSQNVTELGKRNRNLQVIISTFNEKFIFSPEGKAAMHELDSAMRQANTKGQDVDLLERLLLLNTKIVAEYARNINEAQREKEKALRKEAEFKEMELLHMLSSRTKSPEEIIERTYILYTSDKNLKLERETTEILKLLNEHLSEDDRKKLIQEYHWTENDVTKACIGKDRSLFLVGILCKETEKAQCHQPLSEFIAKIQETTNRTDLLHLLVEKRNDVKKRKTNTILRRALETDGESPEDLLLTMTPEFIHDGVEYKLDNSVQAVLKDISASLTNTNKDTLLTRYKWDEDDIIKECIDRDSNVFLLGLQCKEFEKYRKPVDIAKFVCEILEEIKRTDLKIFVVKIRPGANQPDEQSRSIESYMHSMINTRSFKTFIQILQGQEPDVMQRRCRAVLQRYIDIDPD